MTTMLPLVVVVSALFFSSTSSVTGLRQTVVPLRSFGLKHVIIHAEGVGAGEPVTSDGNTLKAPKKGGQRLMIAGSGATSNAGIIAIFDDMNLTTAEKITELSKYFADTKMLNHVHATTLLQRCAKNKIAVTKIISLKALAEILARGSHRKSLRSMEVAHALYGLRVLTEDTPDMGLFLNLVADLILECNEEFKGQEIGNAIFGLQQLSSDSPDVRRLLAILAVKFKLSKTTNLSPQECSNAIFGLRRMTSDSPDAVALLEVLTEKVSSCKEPYNGQCIGNILNGLQGMSSDQPAVISFLRIIIPKIAMATEELSAIHIGSSLMGLKSMSGDVEEVRTIIALLAVKINESPAALDPVSLSSAMNGLRNFKDNFIEIRALLSTLAEKINCMREKELQPKILSNVLYGFRQMTGESPECKQVLTALTSKMGPGRSYTSIGLGRALNGLQSMSAETCPDVTVLYAKLAELVALSPEPLLTRDVGLALAGLKCQSEQSVEARAVLGAIANKLASQSDTETGGPMNSLTASMAMLGLQRFASNCVEVRQILSVLGPLIGGKLSQEGSGPSSPLDAQACANILFAMKKMTSDEAEVRSFLATVAPRIEASRDPMNAQELANAYYGLNGMDSCHPQVRNMLRILNDKLMISTTLAKTQTPPQQPSQSRSRRRSQDFDLDRDDDLDLYHNDHQQQGINMRFTSQGIGNALSGLQSMTHSDGPEALQALAGLVEHLEACEEEMSPMDLSNALFGLQGMNSNPEEVRAILIALVDKFKMSDKGTFGARDIGYSLAGMSAMSQPIVHDEVRALFEELCVKVSRSEFQGQPNLLFNLYGKGVKVKRGDSPFTLRNAESLTSSESSSSGSSISSNIRPKKVFKKT